MSNAIDFIAAYNEVDARLRALYRGKGNLQFTDLVRRCAAFNTTVKKYEDELVSFAKLRNAIVHESTREYVIAEPCDEATELIRHIADLLLSPPLLSSVKPQKITGVEGSVTVGDVFIRISESGYSNLPVYERGRMVGMLNNRRLVRVLGRALAKGEDIGEVLSRPCATAVHAEDMLNFYRLLPKTAAVQDAVDAFEANRRLLAVIVTEDGSPSAPIVNLFTGADLPRLYKLLEE